MNKLFVITVLLLCVAIAVAAYYREDSLQVRENLAVYRGNNEVLLRRLKQSYEDKMETDKRNAELEKAATEDKTDFNWYYDISRSPVIKQLQAR